MKNCKRVRVHGTEGRGGEGSSGSRMRGRQPEGEREPGAGGEGGNERRRGKREPNDERQSTRGREGAGSREPEEREATKGGGGAGSGRMYPHLGGEGHVKEKAGRSIVEGAGEEERAPTRWSRRRRKEEESCKGRELEKRRGNKREGAGGEETRRLDQPELLRRGLTPVSVIQNKTKVKGKKTKTKPSRSKKQNDLPHETHLISGRLVFVANARAKCCTDVCL